MVSADNTWLQIALQRLCPKLERTPNVSDKVNTFWGIPKYSSNVGINAERSRQDYSSHISYKFSTPDTFCFLPNTPRRAVLKAPVKPFCRCLCFLLLLASSRINWPYCFRRIWLRTPASSSSTLWFSAAEVSIYLQLKELAKSLPSVIKQKMG